YALPISSLTIISTASLNSLIVNPSAVGNVISRRASCVKVVDTIKKISNKKTTSINGVRLISGLSMRFGRKFTPLLPLPRFVSSSPAVLLPRLPFVRQYRPHGARKSDEKTWLEWPHIAQLLWLLTLLKYHLLTKLCYHCHAA